MKSMLKNILAAIGAFFVIIMVLSVVISISKRDSALPFGDKVAVVEITGIILDSIPINRTLADYRKRDDVKAVVLRIDSPGGSVGPSQEIHKEIKRLREKKKVVVSMGAVAASGGYYIASAADRIVASPGTITGSIGVIIEFMNVEGLFKKIGIKSYAVKSGAFKDTGSPTKELSEDERRLLQALIDDVHLQFVSAVADGRSLGEAEIEKIADGRILSGSQAMELGLVDSLGNLADAIALGAELAGIKGEPSVIYPQRPKTFIGAFFGEDAAKSIAGLVGGLRVMYLLPDFAG